MNPTTGPAAFGARPPDLGVLTTLAETEQTPFYVYDTSLFTPRADILRAALPAHSRLLYSAKANPHRDVIAAAAAAGCGLEIASAGELDAALGAGVPATDTVLVGPAKSDALLAAALAEGVGLVVVEGARELTRLATVAARTDVDAVPVALRLNLPGAKGSLRMSGHQFGMERAEALACLAELPTAGRLRFTGYHGYLASQLTDAAHVLHNAALVLAEVDELDRRSGTRARVVDLGGGFGLPYRAEDRALDLTELTEGLAELAERHGRDRELVFESGRYLAGPIGALVCRVVDTKTVAGRRFVLLDGGMNSSGLLGLSTSSRPPAHSVVRDGRVVPGGPLANLCGPLCTPTDRLATSVPSAAEVDDLVVWWNTGAYGLTAAPTGFLSFAPPAEIVVAQAEQLTGSPR